MNRPTPVPDGRGSAPEGPIRDQLAALKAQQERLFAQLAHGQQHFKQLARSVWRVQEDERRRLARELHDGLGQNLTLLKNQLDALAIDGAVPAEVRARLSSAVGLCTETLEDTRALSSALIAAGAPPARPPGAPPPPPAPPRPPPRPALVRPCDAIRITS